MVGEVDAICFKDFFAEGRRGGGEREEGWGDYDGKASKWANALSYICCIFYFNYPTDYEGKASYICCIFYFNYLTLSDKIPS